MEHSKLLLDSDRWVNHYLKIINMNICKISMSSVECIWICFILIIWRESWHKGIWIEEGILLEIWKYWVVSSIINISWMNKLGSWSSW